jgi:hypothetical protein
MAAQDPPRPPASTQALSRSSRVAAERPTGPVRRPECLGPAVGKRGYGRDLQRPRRNPRPRREPVPLLPRRRHRCRARTRARAKRRDRAARLQRQPSQHRSVRAVRALQGPPRLEFRPPPASEVAATLPPRYRLRVKRERATYQRTRPLHPSAEATELTYRDASQRQNAVSTQSTRSCR